jgi:anaerobic magnesium-protoporphyrin IX monomethyl ester cyclase
MKVGLLNIRPDYSVNDVPISVPNGTDYLASFVNEHLPGFQAYVDYDARRLIEKKPDIVGISSFTRTFGAAKRIAADIKKYADIPVIIGGHHISALPDNLDQNMDIGVIGEGENTLVELLKYYSSGEKSPEKLAAIDGIVYRGQDGELIRTRSRGLIADLDVLPLPYRTVVSDVKGYWQQSIFTSRGCPFRCKYCAISEFWDKIRYHSPERVIVELNDLIARTNCQTITIHDDLFGINKKRLKTLVDLIRAEKIHQKVSFTCNARASVFDDEICQMFLDMNIRACVFGMESANDRILAYMKGSTTASQNQKALDLCKKYNIIGVPNFIVGFPTETKAEAAETYWFIRKNLDRLTDFRVFPACPLPGTHLWDYAVSKEIVKDFQDWEELDFYFFPEKSVYLNNDIYDRYEYSEILGRFYNLRDETKPFDVFSGELTEKRNFSVNLFKAIAETLHVKDRNTKVLEISSLDLSINDVTPLADRLVSNPAQNGKFLLDGYPEKTFDTVLLLYSLEQTRDPQKELEKIKKLMAPGGTLVIATHNILNPLFLLKILSGTDLYNSWGNNERKIISYYSSMITSAPEEERAALFKNFTSANIYSFWGISDPKNISYFSRPLIEKAVLQAGFQVTGHKSLKIEMDEKIINLFDQVRETASRLLQTDIQVSNGFSDLTFCNLRGVIQPS